MPVPDDLPSPAPGAPAAAPAGVARWRGHAEAAALCVAAAAVCAPLAQALDPTSLVLVFMLAVVVAAARHGRGPALLAAAVSVLLFNLIFVPPRFSLAVADARMLFTFGVMLIVGLVVGQLTASLRTQAQAAIAREQHVRNLYGISRELGSAIAVEQVAQAIERYARTQLQADAVLWARDTHDGLQRAGPAGDPALDRLAHTVVAQGQPAQHGPALLLPLRATMAVRGALAVQRDGPPWSDDERRLLDTCASLLAGALERLHYIEVAQASALEIEGERLRNSLLSTISHDLRTPLASLVGLAESLLLTRPALAAPQAEIAAAMLASARRMSALAHKLLDMARLESGAVQLNLQWQPLEEVVGSALAATADITAGRAVWVALADDLPLIRVDAVLMERVLANLLENAVKYTPEGTPIEISADLAADALQLSVRDHGPGLPAGREMDLFRKFERGHREGAIAGVGLGLALCRAIVEAHQGRLHAEHPADGGARFVIRLPLGQPPAVPAEADVPANATSGTTAGPAA